MCLSLGIGKTFCIPPSSEIPTGSSVVRLLQDSGAKALLTVPSILEDVALLPHDQGITALRELDFVAFGGGIPKSSVGQRLDAAGVRLINHYGATETGPLTPFFVPQPGHDWHYIKLRRDIFRPLEVKLQPVEDSNPSGQAYKLSLRPFGWAERFELQDLLISHDGSLEEFSIAGRTDDLICLATGEKVRPTILESALNQHPDVKSAVAFGDGRFELGVMIEPWRDVGSESARDLFKHSLWLLVEEAGQQMDSHARISSLAAMLIVSPGALPRSDKGTVLRREINRLFSAEISQVYQNLEAAVSAPVFDWDNPTASIRALVIAAGSFRVSNWPDCQDFFELGMDSLHATKLRRLLLASIRRAGVESTGGSHADRITDDIVYRNPSIEKLVGAITEPNTTTSASGLSPLDSLEKIAQRYSTDSNRDHEHGITVLMTGSTGSLGSHLLSNLANNPSVSRVVALVRSADESGLERLKRVFGERAITLEDQDWSKIEVHETDASAAFLGLEEATYQNIAQRVTHIIHVAWPMSFKMSLQSFGAAFRGLQNLIELACEAHRHGPWKRPRMLFISSISTVGNWASFHKDRFVPEEPIQGRNCALDLGYAEAKLVCEKMIEQASRDYPQVQVGYARVGQVSGAQNGFWNADEHFVAVLAASHKIGKLPNLQGVSPVPLLRVDQVRNLINIANSAQTLSWLPVDTAAAAVAEILLDHRPLQLVYHLENPVRQSWQEMITYLAQELGIDAGQIIPFERWLEEVKHLPAQENPARELTNFVHKEFRKMSCGEVILDTTVARQSSATLRRQGAIQQEQVGAYLRYWKNLGVLG